MSYVVDTDVVSELRKRERASPAVLAWFRSREPRELHIGVLTVGELRRGAERLRRRDPTAAEAITAWVDKIFVRYRRRIPDIDSAVAERWGRLGAPNPPPDVDGSIAATALVRDFVVVTRNVRHIAPTGARYFNPFDGRSGP